MFVVVLFKNHSSRNKGDIAQLVEHLLCTQGVSGSNPLISRFFNGSSILVSRGNLVKKSISSSASGVV